eukprot:12757_1
MVLLILLCITIHTMIVCSKFTLTVNGKPQGNISDDDLHATITVGELVHKIDQTLPEKIKWEFCLSLGSGTIDLLKEEETTPLSKYGISVIGVVHAIQITQVGRQMIATNEANFTCEEQVDLSTPLDLFYKFNPIQLWHEFEMEFMFQVLPDDPDFVHCTIPTLVKILPLVSITLVPPTNRSLFWNHELSSLETEMDKQCSNYDFSNGFIKIIFEHSYKTIAIPAELNRLPTIWNYFYMKGNSKVTQIIFNKKEYNFTAPTGILYLARDDIDNTKNILFKVHKQHVLLKELRIKVNGFTGEETEYTSSQSNDTPEDEPNDTIEETNEAVITGHQNITYCHQYIIALFVLCVVC